MHAKDWKACASLLLLSLGVQLSLLNQVDQGKLPSLKSCGNMEELIALLNSQAGLLGPFEQMVLTTPAETIIHQFTPQNSAAWSLVAETLRFFAGAKQNMDDFAVPENVEWFAKTNGLARQIWEKIDTQDSRWWVGQLIYNTGRFMYDLGHPKTEGQLEHIQGSLATLDALTPNFS